MTICSKPADYSLATESALYNYDCDLRLSELNALLASTRSAASQSSELKAFLTACTAASIPDICPPQSCRHLDAFWTSVFTTDSTALAMIRLAVSPMPMGRTPGVLSRAMRRQASSGEMDFGSTVEAHKMLHHATYVRV